MNLQNFLLVDWKDLEKEVEEALNLPVASSGFWNAPKDGPFLAIDNLAVSDCCDYFSGESKYIVIRELTIPCDRQWKEVHYPVDPQEFISRFGGPAANEDYMTTYPFVRNGISIKLFDILEFLVVSGKLERDSKIMIRHEW